MAPRQEVDSNKSKNFKNALFKNNEASWSCG